MYTTKQQNANEKIGILTFHDTMNYGAMLQATALCRVVREAGYDCEIIDYHCPNIDKRELPHWNYKGRIIGKGILFYAAEYIKKLRLHRSFMAFLQREARVSKKRYCLGNIKEANAQYSTFLVGSDMLWCTKYTQDDFTFMLDFVANGRRLAFSTSVGYEWSEDEKRKIVPLLNQFGAIALREGDMCGKVHELLGKDIPHVCDPTMLIDVNYWRAFVQGGGTHQDYCLVYMDDGEKHCMLNAKEYSAKHNMEVKVLRHETLLGFMQTIAEAKMLFTASYHGMLFAAYFHVPFVYFNKDSSRLEDAASILSLSGRRGGSIDTDDMEAINWEKVDKAREAFRASSLAVLNDMLGGEK